MQMWAIFFSADVAGRARIKSEHGGSLCAIVQPRWRYEGKREGKEKEKRNKITERRW